MVTLPNARAILSPEDWITPKLQTSFVGGERGIGLVAAAPIMEGELVWVSFLHSLGCDVRSWSDIRDDAEAVHFAYQIGPDAFSLSQDRSGDLSNFINHACAPTLAFDHGVEPKLAYFEVLLDRGQLGTVGVTGSHIAEVRRDVRHFAATRAWKPAPSPVVRRARQVLRAGLIDAVDVELVVARRTLPVGAEATLDYSTFWTVSDQPFECRCGSVGCRRKVRAEDYRRHHPSQVSLHVRRLLRVERGRR